MILLKIITFIFAFGLIYHFATLKWLNPYKLLFFFGKKGHGKSTLLTKDAYQAFKKGRKVYSNSPLTFQIRDSKTHKKTLVSTLLLEPTDNPRINSLEITVTPDQRSFVIWLTRCTLSGNTSGYLL